MALPPGPSLFRDDFALNGVLRRRSPFKRGATDKNASSARPQTAIGAAIHGLEGRDWRQYLSDPNLKNGPNHVVLC